MIRKSSKLLWKNIYYVKESRTTYEDIYGKFYQST